jgi:hypothetical protein
MAGAYVRKKPSEASRWGVELTAQEGKDDELFGFSATAPNIAGFKVLRHLGPTNVTYLAPVGKGLTVQGGIFSSLIGYDSLYAKDNLNYTTLGRRLADFRDDIHVRFAAVMERRMLDLVSIGLTIGFFLVALAYVRACERLQ